MLSVLYSLCLEDEPLTSIDRFVEIRRLSGRSATVADALGDMYCSDDIIHGAWCAIL